jgi:hypothetical protein
VDFVDFVDILSKSSIHAALRAFVRVDIRVDIFPHVDILRGWGAACPPRV